MYKSACYTTLAFAPFCGGEENDTGFTQHGQFSGGQKDVDERVLNDILDEAAALPPHERDAYVEAQCGDDAVLKYKLQELLKGIDTPAPEGFLKPSKFLPLLRKMIDEG